MKSMNSAMHKSNKFKDWEQVKGSEKRILK